MFVVDEDSNLVGIFLNGSNLDAMDRYFYINEIDQDSVSMFGEFNIKLCRYSLSILNFNFLVTERELLKCAAKKMTNELAMDILSTRTRVSGLLSVLSPHYINWNIDPWDDSIRIEVGYLTIKMPSDESGAALFDNSKFTPFDCDKITRKDLYCIQHSNLKSRNLTHISSTVVDTGSISASELFAKSNFTLAPRPWT